MSEVKVDKISPKTGTSMTVGDSGDTFTVPSGATLTVAGALNVTGTTSLADGTVAVAELDIDGATDINAAIVDADLFVVDDGAGGTNRKTAASRLKTFILADNSIDSDMYVDGSIDLAHMSVNSIDSDQYVDGSIDTAHIGATQVTGAKLNSDVISAQTALTAEPADTDEFMVSDAGVLKRIDYSLIRPSGTLVKTAGVDTEVAAAAVELQSCFSDTYDTYMFHIRRCLPVSNNDSLYMRIMTGTNTAVTGSLYYYAMRYREDTGSDGGVNGQADDKFRPSYGLCNVEENAGLSGIMWMTLDKTDDAGNAFKYHASFSTMATAGNVLTHWTGAGIYRDTSADEDITGFKLYFGSGNVSKVQMTCYGLVE